MDAFSGADDSNYRRQKVYKNHGFTKAVLISASDATNEADEAILYERKSEEDATTSNKYTKKTQQHPERTD